MRREFLTVGLLVVLLSSCVGAGRVPSISGTQPPVITRSHASDQGAYGQTWKIYIEAEDPDGDILKITSDLQQEGVRYSQPVDSIFVKKGDQKYLKGFLALDTY